MDDLSQEDIDFLEQEILSPSGHSQSTKLARRKKKKSQMGATVNQQSLVSPSRPWWFMMTP